jgi:hypothetical protein
MSTNSQGGPLLTVPSGVDFNTVEGFKKLLPNRDELNDWQQIQWDMAVRQFQNKQPYMWTQGHDGCTENQMFRDRTILRDTGNDGVFCCGLSLEHLFMTHREWFGDDFESDIDMTYEMLRDIKAYFFVYATDDRRYEKGCGTGILRYGQLLKARWEAAKKSNHEDWGESFVDDVGLSFHYHTDPYKAKFGDYVQLQSQRDIFKGGGHAGIFVGIESRVHKGKEIEVVRLYQANYTEDYGFLPGVNMGWYTIGKYHSGTDWNRVFHFGSVSPAE